MTIENIIPHKTVVIPEIFNNKIQILYRCELSRDELAIFGYCLQICAKVLVEDGFTNNNLTKVTIVFIDDGQLLLNDNEMSTYGCHFSLIVYHMNKIRKLNNMMKTALLYVEELVHHYWRIEDETLVKYKDVEILKLANSNYSIELLKEWGVNWE